MIRIFYGDDREKAQAEIRRVLGEYEVVDGEELTPAMMPSVFLGVSLFAEKRKIVVKDLGVTRECMEKLIEYVKTPHEVVVWEQKVDKRLKMFKDLAAAGVEMREFKRPEAVDPRRVFDIYTTALVDGAKAVKLLDEMIGREDPFAMVGLFTTQAVRGFNGRAREKRILKELAKLDLEMKSTTVEPWHLVKSFLLRLSQL